jgi:hypothetical protein
MCDQTPLRTDELELENRLKRLVPTSHRLQRDTLMFRAGQRTARRQSRPWQALAIGSLLGVVLLGWEGLTTNPGRDALLMSQTEELTPIEVPFPTRPVTPPLPVTPPNFAWLPLPAPVIEHLRLRYQVVMDGAEALPAPSAYAAPDASMETLSDWYPGTAPGRGIPALIPNLKPRQYGDPT